MLINQASELLDIPESVISTAIDHEIDEGELIEADFPKEGCIYLASLYLSEKSIGRNLRTLAKGTPPWPSIDPEKAIPWVEKKLSYTCYKPTRSLRCSHQIQGDGYDWWTRCGQDDNCESHTDHPSCQGRSHDVLRSHKSCSQTSVRVFWYGGQNDSSFA